MKCTGLFPCVPALTLHSTTVCDGETEREKERLVCDSCETVSVSLGTSRSSRITVSCVYSCYTHTHRHAQHTHIGKIYNSCCFMWVFMHVAFCLLHVVNKGAHSLSELPLMGMYGYVWHIKWWYNEPGNLIPVSEICFSSAPTHRGEERATSESFLITQPTLS